MRQFTDEHRGKLSLAKKGKPSPKKGLPGKKLTPEQRLVKAEFLKSLPRTEEWRRKIGATHKGEKCTFWKGGVSRDNELIRKSLEYKIWRTSVFKRDDYTCQICFTRGGIINADHIKPFALFPDLRFDLDNGRTLCASCHRKTDTYGWNILHIKRNNANTETGIQDEEE